MSSEQINPLDVEEVIACMQAKWGVSYDLQLVVRKNRLYLHIMWAYLEQQSFPLNEEEYKNHINEVLEVINRLGLAPFFREWIQCVQGKPRLGRAISLHLNSDERLKEFVL